MSASVVSGGAVGGVVVGSVASGGPVGRVAAVAGGIVNGGTVGEKVL